MRRSCADDRAEDADLDAVAAWNADDRRPDVVAHQCKAFGVTAQDLGVPDLVAERGRMAQRQTDGGERILDGPQRFAVVVDATPVLDVEVADCGLTLGGAHRFEDAKKVVAPLHVRVPADVGSHFVLHHQADRLPTDLEVAFRCNLADPECGHPAEWAGGVDPEANGGRHGSSMP